MICKYCNSQISDDAKFCSECGLAQAENAQLTPETGKIRPKGKTLRIAAVIAALLLVFAAFFAVNYFTNTARNSLKGSWQREAESTTGAEVITYVFNSENGQSIYAQSSAANAAESVGFEWFVTDDKELIILWSNTTCTRYVWNPDISNYNMSANEYNWYVKGGKLYIGSSTEMQGYIVYTKQGI